MIEYLERLLEEGKSQEALKKAEESMLNPNNTRRDILAIQCTLLRARFTLGLYESALRAGESAIQMSIDLKEWDYYGYSCLYTGCAYGMLGNYQEALVHLQGFTSELPHYRKAEELSTFAWYNIGIAYLGLSDHKESHHAFHVALQVADFSGNQRMAFGIRQAILEHYLVLGELAAIPKLLVQCNQYLRQNPNAHEHHKGRMFHVQMRTRFAIHTIRYTRARAVASRGLKEATSLPRFAYDFHIFLASIAKESGEVEEALNHSAAAKVYAKQINRCDLEASADEMTYDLVRAE